MENDTDNGGGEDLSLDEAAAAYVKSQVAAVHEDQAEPDEELEAQTTEDEAPDEGEDVEGEGEQDAEDQSENETEDPDTDQGRFVADNAKVRLPDGSVVSVADLKSGSLMQADYTRKTQEVAAERKAVTELRERTTQQEQQLLQQLEYASTLLQSFNPQPPDPSLLNSDPLAYFQAKEQFDSWQQHLGHITQEQQRVLQERQAKFESERQERMQREWDALLRAVPELKDKSKLEAFASDINAAGSAYGFSPEELKSVALDHRQARVLRDAMAWRKLQSSKPKAVAKVEGRPPVQKGGKRLSPDAQKAASASTAMNRLKQSGSVNDAVAAYLARSQKG